MDASSSDHGVRASQVNVFEDAPLGTGRSETAGAQPSCVNGDHLARLDLANKGATDDVDSRSFGGDYPTTRQAPQHQRSDALRITSSAQGVVVHENKAEGALKVRQDLGGNLLKSAVIGRHEGCYQRGVAAGVHPVLVGNLGIRGTLSDEGFEGAGVGEVAVMGQS